MLHSRAFENRSYYRSHVRWPILVGSTAKGSIGDICDIAPCGFFVRPFADDIASSFIRGDDLQFKYRIPAGHIQIRGVVRWVGWSSEHQCRGFGVEFEATEPVIDFLLAQAPRPGDLFISELYL